MVDLFKCSAGPTLQVLHPPLPSLLVCLNDVAYLFSTPMANPFDLNICVEEDDDDNVPLDLNELIMEDDNNNGKQQRQISFSVCAY